jgi:adenine-specific DNA-methyltransferase
MKKLDATDPGTRSRDVVAENIERLKAMFPELITEGSEGAAVNVDVLKDLVADATVTDCEEKYGFSWHGKRRARRLALTPSTGTVRPCPEESVDWESTQNLMIKGDNLDVLKLLQKSYGGKVKLIYIDPPYNTGKEFVYPDRFQDSLRNYLELTGQTEGGAKISSNTEASGRFHTDWLNMMWPRLYLARSLLRSDGVIFVSIDDNEEASLRIIMDEIFGEENRLSSLVWDLGTGSTAGHFTRSHESILCYARTKSSLRNFSWRQGGTITASALKKISRLNPASEIAFPAGVEIEGGGDAEFEGTLGGEITQTVTSGRMRFVDGRLSEPVTLSAGWAMRSQIESWVAGKETFDTKGQRVLRFFFSRTGMLNYEKERSVVNPKSVLRGVANTADGSRDLRELGFEKSAFDFPKPVKLLKYLVELVTDPSGEDLVLDFFAGSCTTGQAVMEANATDDGDRRFICVQLPEPMERPLNLPDGTTVKDLAAVGAERLRRSGQALRQNTESENGGRWGFRMYALATSNIRAWDPDPDDLEGTLLDSIEHLKADRTEIDVLHELLIKLGLELCVPIEMRSIGGKQVHAVGAGVLFACLTESILPEDVETLAQGLVEWHEELAPAGEITCVFRDSAFADDVAKTNTAAILEQHGIDNVRSL